MSKVVACLACDLKGAIGLGDKLPWRFKNELKHFKELTTNKHILMGSKTFRSLPNILTSRTVYVLTRNSNAKFKNAITVNSVDEFLELSKDQDEVFICGGKELYESTQHICDSMIVSVIQSICKADVYFESDRSIKWITDDSKTKEILSDDGLRAIVLYMDKYIAPLTVKED